MNNWPSTLGWPAALALANLVLALVLGWGATPAWQQQARDLIVVAVQPVTRQPTAPLEASLPDVGDPAERVADLLALALRHGVNVERTQQRLEPGTVVQRLQVGMNARAPYADLRAFVAAALLADPGLALDRLQWHRATETGSELDAEFQWSLLRERPATKAVSP
jgi:hypothetical protein